MYVLSPPIAMANKILVTVFFFLNIKLPHCSVGSISLDLMKSSGMESYPSKY